MSPFTNLGPDTSAAYFSAGTTDQVALYLGRIKGIKVASPVAVADLLRAKKPLRDLASQLGAAAVVSGSVSASGDRLRVLVQVDDPRSGQRLWAESYDRGVKDLFAVQAEVALRVAQSLGKRLTRADRTKVATPQTTSVEADMLVRRARALVHEPVPDRNRVDGAFALLRRAIALDPQFGAAYVELAGAFMWLNYLVTDPAALDSVIRYSQRGLDLGLDFGGQGMAYRLMSLSSEDGGHIRKAIELNRRSLQLDPRQFWATQGLVFDFLTIGRPDSAYPSAQRAMELRPDRLTAHLSYVWIFLSVDSVEAADARAGATVQLFPEHSNARVSLARLWLLRRQPDSAFAALREPLAPPPGRKFNGEPSDVLGAAMAAGLHAGQYRRVDQLYRRLLREGPPADDSLGRPASDEWTCHRVGTDWAFARWSGLGDEAGRAVLQKIRGRDRALVEQGTENPCLAYEAAAVSAALGDSTAAFVHLRQAIRSGWLYYRYAQIDPLFQSIRRHPVFQSLLNEVADSAAVLRKRIVALAH